MSPHFKIKYQMARNKVAKESKEWVFKLNHQKQFWKIVKVLTSQKPTIPTLALGGKLFSEDCDKARALNANFSSCFNTNIPPIQIQTTSIDVQF